MEDEIFALSAIYDELLSTQQLKDSSILVRFEEHGAVLEMLLPAAYPAALPVVGKVDVSSERRNGPRASAALAALQQQLDITSLPADNIIYELIELFRQTVDLHSAARAEVIESRSVPATSAPQLPLQPTAPKVDKCEVVPALVIYKGPLVIEADSSFQAQCARISSKADLNAFFSAVMEDKKVSKATHNISAYRYSVNGVTYADYDDDGEKAAGSKLADLLLHMQVHNAAVVVSRWFGGTLLGPQRFRLITNTARGLLETHGFGNNNSNSGKSSDKKKHKT